MSALAAQQRQLKQAIVRGDDAPGAAVSGRLHIYRQAYAARLVAALRDNFGALPQVLGDDAFDALARAYIEAYPSRKPSIRWFGDQLTAFMASRDDLVPHAAITDLARMEWGLRAAFDAADANPIDVAALAAVAADAWPALVLVPLPSVQLLDMGWCVEPIWRALQGVAVGDELPELPEPEAFEHGLVVWRSGLATRSIGRCISELSPYSSDAKVCAASTPMNSRIAVPALPMSSGCPAARKLALPLPCTRRRPPSSSSMRTPSRRSAFKVARQSSLCRKPLSSVTPCARPPSSSERCETDLSPGTCSSPARRAPAAARQPLTAPSVGKSPARVTAKCAPSSPRVPAPPEHRSSDRRCR